MTTRKSVDKYKGPYTQGIDVSRWQGIIDWDEVKSKNSDIKYVFTRIGDGRDLDPSFSRNWKGIKDAGFIRGYYRYFRADRDGTYQAELDLSALTKVDVMTASDIPPVLDLEDGSGQDLQGGIFMGKQGSTLPVELVAAEALEYLELLEKELGCRPLIYTGQTFHWWFSQRHPNIAKAFAKYPLWTPSYTKTCRMPVDAHGKGFPWEEWTFWQYTSKGHAEGIKTPIDMNYFHGNEDELYKFIKDSWTPDKANICCQCQCKCNK